MPHQERQCFPENDKAPDTKITVSKLSDNITSDAYAHESVSEILGVRLIGEFGPVENTTPHSNHTEVSLGNLISSLQPEDLPLEQIDVIFDPSELFKATHSRQAFTAPRLHIGTNKHGVTDVLQPFKYLELSPGIDVSFHTWEKVGVTVGGDVLFIHRSLTNTFGRLFTVVVPAQVGTDSESSTSEKHHGDSLPTGSKNIIETTLDQYRDADCPSSKGQNFSRVLQINKSAVDTNETFASNNRKDHDNTTDFNNSNCSAMEHSESSFVQNHDRVPKPLHIRKQPSNSNFAQRQDLHNNNPYKSPTRTRFPPRNSSIGMLRAPNLSIVAEDDSKTPRSAISQWTDERVSDTSSEGKHSTKSTVDGIKDHYITSPSSEIMGNFVPISPNSRHASGNEVKFFAPLRSANPYEFDPDSPYVHQERHDTTLTTFSNFIEPAMKDMSHNQTHHKAAPNPPSLSHLARPDFQDYAVQRPINYTTPAKTVGHAVIRRSESSPNITPGRFAEKYPDRRESSPNLAPGFIGRFPDQITKSVTQENPRYRTGSESTSHRRLGPHQQARAASPETPRRRVGSETAAQIQRGRTPDRPRQRFNKYGEAVQSGGSYQSQSSNNFDGEHEFRTPSRQTHRNVQPGSESNRHRAGSPTKTLRDVNELDESIIESPMPPSLSEMKRRSRSPMKKMFGENGWLGKTPNEAYEINRKPKDSQAPKEKTSMMGRIKSKLGEMAERADLNGLSTGRRASLEKPPPKLSVLSVSLSAPEQAKIYMELELMVVISANTFLMNQFSQGRIAVDTIKKIVDVWKSKGRPVVIEFMYDQGTQRDLVALNQHNFRFYGERAADSMRINSMLYNWKSVASLMAVRTLCNADTVILKLLFDIEQILELLGAREPIMCRLQQIRASANEAMRLERLKRDGDSKQVPDNTVPGRDTWSSRGSSDNNGNSRGFNGEDPYGGMKLVPQSYVEVEEKSYLEGVSR